MNLDILFLYAWFMAELLIILLANIYLIASYSHPNDTNFAKQWPVRILTLIGFCLMYFPLLIVHLDVTQSQINDSEYQFRNAWLAEILF